MCLSKFLFPWAVNPATPSCGAVEYCLIRFRRSRYCASKASENRFYRLNLWLGRLNKHIYNIQIHKSYAYFDEGAWKQIFFCCGNGVVLVVVVVMGKYWFGVNNKWVEESSVNRHFSRNRKVKVIHTISLIYQMLRIEKSNFDTGKR